MKSLNKVQLIGNVTRDPELKYTPAGTAVCNFSIATNRGWTTETGEKKEEADFTRVVAWNKLAEICGQLLKKGRKVYVEGRLTTRSWQDKDGQTRYMTEVVISDMILLDSRKEDGAPDEYASDPIDMIDEDVKESDKKEDKVKEKGSDVVDDIPF